MKLINNTINFPKYLIKKFEKVNTLDDVIEVYKTWITDHDKWYMLRWGFTNNIFEMFNWDNESVQFQIENK